MSLPGTLEATSPSLVSIPGVTGILEVSSRRPAALVQRVRLEPEASSFRWEALSTELLASESLGEHTG